MCRFMCVWFFLRSPYIHTHTHELCFLKSKTQSPWRTQTHSAGTSLMIRNPILSSVNGFSGAYRLGGNVSYNRGGWMERHRRHRLRLGFGSRRARINCICARASRTTTKLNVSSSRRLARRTRAATDLAVPNTAARVSLIGRRFSDGNDRAYNNYYKIPDLNRQSVTTIYDRRRYSETK